METNNTKIAPSLRIPKSPAPANLCKNAYRDGYAPCIVCGRGVKLANHKLFVWVHEGGGHVVTTEEGERLNASGESGADLGSQPIGRDCLKKFPELKPYVAVWE
jgi:hypothetical protein